jgi:hypothetical protein
VPGKNDLKYNIPIAVVQYLATASASDSRNSSNCTRLNLIFSHSTRPDLLSATHPSDHNAVRFIPQTQRARVINLALYASMARKKSKATLKSPKKPVNRPPQGPGSSPPGNPSSARLQRSRSTFTHDATPFLVPIPTYYAPGVVIGAADCVADGHSLQPAGGCCSVCLYFIHEMFFSNLFLSVSVEVLPEVDVDQDRRVDAPEELGPEVVTVAEVGQRVVVVVDRTVVVEEAEEEAEDV